MEGLDAIFIGPYDLSASMQLTAQFDHAVFKEVMATILNKSKRARVTAGMHVVQPSKDELIQRIEDGYQFLAYSIDAVMLVRGSDCT